MSVSSDIPDIPPAASPGTLRRSLPVFGGLVAIPLAILCLILLIRAVRDFDQGAELHLFILFVAMLVFGFLTMLSRVRAQRESRPVRQRKSDVTALLVTLALVALMQSFDSSLSWQSIASGWLLEMARLVPIFLFVLAISRMIGSTLRTFRR